MCDKSDALGDENVESVGLICAKERFSENEEVIEMLNNISNICGPESTMRDAERAYEKFQLIFSQYNEQPHLLDPYLDDILSKIVSIVRQESAVELKHTAFKYLFLLINTRGYKVIVRCLPHEVADLEPTLQLLEAQDSNDTATWETRYCLLLWLSIIVMIPFHMSRLDSGAQSKTVMGRLCDVCQKYLLCGDKCREGAAFLSARFLTRSDVKEIYLADFLKWINEKVSDEITEGSSWKRFGPLACLASILKHGKREDLLPYAPQLLHCVMDAKCLDDYYPLSSKFSMKIVARIGLTFLKPRVASWRYNRGSRSLTSNLSNADVQATDQANTNPTEDLGGGDEQEEDDDIDIPSEIEDIIEYLIQGLKNENNTTRWSAAKGIGRVMSRLNKQCGDDVVCSILELLNPRNSDGAWQGGCLALAELARRGLLLPKRLEDVVPLVVKALTFEEPRGYNSVGANVRDAACYVCWAFARAYHPNIILPFSTQIAEGLLIATCFDREINCRRAAAAAFQENVGRLGNFPHGIEILTTADYFSVGIRSNAYLKISVYIAQFEEYTKGFINHLFDRKVDNWDPNIRSLAAKALFNLTPCAPQYILTHGFQALLSLIRSIDLNARHGAILALGEIVHGLSLLNISLDSSQLHEVENLVSHLKERQVMRGQSGEFTKIACCSFIENCSRAKLPFNGKPVVAEWQELLDDCLCHESTEMRQTAAAALTHLCTQYYSLDSVDIRSDIINKYTSTLQTGNKISRMGYTLALGSLPPFMLHGFLPTVVQSLVKCSKITQESVKWAESRAAALKALSSICLNIHLHKIDEGLSCYSLVVEIIEALLNGMKDYTSDSRGDVGAWVREAAMLGLKDVITLATDEASEVLDPDLICQSFVEISQQAVEKIDRTRGYAGRVFSSLLHKDGKPVPHIPDEAKLKEIFPADRCDSINWIAACDTFPLFIQLLSLPRFTKAVMLGLVGSVGGLTESLVKYSSQALFDHLRQQEHTELVRLCDTVATIFEQYQHEDRITIPLLTFLERLLTSNSIAPVLIDPQNAFAKRLLRCGKTEIAKTVNSKKLTASVDFFCQLIQVPGEVSRRSLVQLGILLCHRFLWLRRVTATKMYEALIVYSEECGVDPSTLDDAMAILSDTEWDTLSTEAARAQRNKLCQLLNIPMPTAGTPSNK
ncbi:tubulin-specific chaperone D-like [Macrosteles quadrilineatus]|uniref:tubulin-specific chaperone D-like n=1 Tax=Macrosteles quadrilineatus TaxID=74068 RepID=UPI0023E27D84|nr:tubulin-specific chaperone D-like [Macrosteles quadrilineatus]